MYRRALLLTPLSLALARKAAAQPFRLGTITIDHPWAKPSVDEAAAMFMQIVNDGPRPDRLLGGASPIAEKVILRARDGSAVEYFDLLPKRPVSLRPGGRYIALRGLNRPLALDDTFPLTLHFAESGDLTVTVVVEAGASEE
jgi:copper(I)-binding protein